MKLMTSVTNRAITSMKVTGSTALPLSPRSVGLLFQSHPPPRLKPLIVALTRSSLPTSSLASSMDSLEMTTRLTSRPASSTPPRSRLTCAMRLTSLPPRTTSRSSRPSKKSSETCQSSTDTSLDAQMPLLTSLQPQTGSSTGNLKEK